MLIFITTIRIFANRALGLRAMIVSLGMENLTHGTRQARLTISHYRLEAISVVNP